ncbi:MAG: protein-export chaperone SecB [Hyphomicrobiales bacterium]|nr:protein-export chaperone SecB [Hyphomicrobiales bacterium]
MTKSTVKNGAENIQAQDNQPQVNVLGQYIKDLSFENPNAPDVLRGQIKNPNLKLGFNVIVKSMSDDMYEVALAVEGGAQADEGFLYNVELVYAGVFRLKNLPKEAIQPFLYVDCPALLFPFVRRIMADMTREGGFPPLLLDPIDFGGLYRQNLMRQQAQTEN